MIVHKIYRLIVKNFHFLDNGIETAELDTLLESEWKDILYSLIPIPGHRIRFIKHLKEFIAERKHKLQKVQYICFEIRRSKIF